MKTSPARGSAYMCLLAAGILLMLGFAGGALAESVSRITDQPIPLQTEGLSKRTEPLLEIGDHFLDSGALSPGIELPTGAVWKPSLMVFGTLRTALQSFDNGRTSASEWANRLDLFANLRLTGTERLVLGLRPLDRRGTNSGFNIEPDDESQGFVDATNANIKSLFFEGEVGQIFPKLARDIHHPLDIGFSVGRQPLFIQEGMMIDDFVDSVGLVLNSLSLPGASYWKATALYGWGEIDRNDNRADPPAKLVGLFNEIEFLRSTVNVDLAYVLDSGTGEGDAAYAGVSSVQRIGAFNTAFRVNTSQPSGADTAAVSQGTLLFAELSLTPERSMDVAYINVFWGFGRFSSVARDPANSGPLGRTGILFSAVGMGRYRPALGNRPHDGGGGSIGYQMLLDGWRKQLIFEIGGGKNTDDAVPGVAGAGGVRYQQAFGAHTILQLDGFIAGGENRDNPAYGLRLELQFKF